MEFNVLSLQGMSSLEAPKRNYIDAFYMFQVYNKGTSTKSYISIVDFD